MGNSDGRLLVREARQRECEFNESDIRNLMLRSLSINGKYNRNSVPENCDDTIWSSLIKFRGTVARGEDSQRICKLQDYYTLNSCSDF